MKPFRFRSSKSRDAARPAGDVVDEAAAWVVRQKAGFDPAEKARFTAWLDADPQHPIAMRELSAAWDAAGFPAAAGQADVALRRLSFRERRRAHRRRVCAVTAFAVAAITVGTRLLRDSFETDSSIRSAVAAARPERKVLSDGSIIELNSDANIGIEFSADRRGIKLYRGEVFFIVAKDPARPFIVTAGGVEIRAVGTVFSIRCAPQRVDVLVTEGGVAVDRADDRGTLLKSGDGTGVLSAGHRVSIPLDRSLTAASIRVEPVSPVEIDHALRWRNKRVEFTRASLVEAVQLFNRQNQVQLSIGDPVAGAILISGMFLTDDPEGFARLMEAGFGLQVERSGNSIVLRSR